MGITLRQFEIFQQVALTQHITKASEKLFLSQSAVSMAISDLESELGGPLFDRRGRSLTLNERGRQLLPEVVDILRKVDNTVRVMRDSAEDPVGILKVGASTTIGNYLLPKIIGEFSKLYPRVEVTLQVGNTHQIEVAVEKGELDLGLIEGPSHHSNLECLAWREDELIVVAGPNHLLASKPVVDLGSLREASWIMREEGSGTREVFETVAKEKIGKLKIKLELGHTEAIKKAVEAGLGLSCLSRLTLDRELEHNWLVEIKGPLSIKRSLIILVHNKKYRTKAFEAFQGFLQA